uniref:G_PROTEIN_RECEP_F1_2 domain-containing protein n=1 Tax=Haemonchus contortus TaxID=6289 RepID=A0A7I4Y951_HAECO
MSIREELSFVNVSEDVRQAITTAGSSTEIFIYIIGLFISFTFLCALCFSSTLHVNLRVVLGSLTVSLCLTAICKVCISISKIIHTGWTQHDIDVLIFLWRICMPSVCYHMVLLSFERLLATVKSTTYEKQSLIFIICGIIASIWLLSYASVNMQFYIKVEKKLRAGIMLLFYIICISMALLIIYFVHRYNYSNWKKRRGLMIFSESYQVRENIRTARFINRIFILFGTLFSISIVIYIGIGFATNSLLGLILSVMFDIVCSLPCSLIPLIVINGEERMYRRYKQIFQKCKVVFFFIAE